MSENLNNEENQNSEENLNVNRVELADGTVLMDITDTTAEPENVLAGQVFYNAAGTRSTGAYDPTGIIDDTAGAGVTNKTWSANKMTGELDDKADKTDTVLNTTLSRGRKANTTVGTRSFAFGEDVTASNNDSHAEGRMTVSSGTQSHAEGNSTTASGSAAHAEGQATTASGEQAHAEGGGTVASGHLSHAEGGSTTASGTWSHAEGGGTIASGLRSHAEGQGGTFSVNMVRKTSAAAGANSHSEGYSTLAEGESSHSEGTVTYASGYGSHAEGSGTQATGSQSHAEGGGTEASGSGSHSEGGGTHATGLDAHAEGQGTVASGDFTHAQGNNTTAAGRSSHVFGENNIIDSYDSWSTWVSGTSYKVGDRVKRDGSNYICKTANSDILFVGSKWENPNGKMTYVEIVGNGKDSNNRANARTLDWQGNETLAGGLTGGGSIAMGGNVTASRNFSIAVGGGVAASGDYSQAFGSGSTASGSISYAEGQNTVASGNMSHAEGSGTQATSVFTHAEGCGSTASGSHSHAEGNGTKATNYADHAEGNNTTASGGQSHAEGSGATSAGFASHAEGYNTKAANGCSHAEGYGGTYTKDGITYTSQAAGYADHVEGYQCLTENHQPGSHAEGYWTRAEGNSTHSEGAYTVAKGNYSHAEGYETIATGAFSHVSGQYNTADSYDRWAEWTANTSYSVGDKVKRTTTSSGVTTITAYVCKTANSDSSFTSSKWTNLNGQMNYAEIIGNGTSNSRSNARALDWDGNEYLAGDLYVHAGTGSTGGTKVATVTDVSGKIDATEKGAANGIAELDSSGKVPTSQLPSYVDDVLEYASASNFPAEGETGKIYVALDTNKTYRWGGTEYVEISASLALGETSDTAYRGDRGKTAYDHASAKGNAYASGLYKITTNSEGHVTGATAVAKSDITALGIPGSDTNTHRPIQLSGTQILGDNDTPLNLIPGNNVSFSYSGGNVTVVATDTTYESKAAASGGTDVSLVTTGEKYNWNNIINDTAGDGDTNKTWSADKLTDEFTSVNEAIEQLEFKGDTLDYAAIHTFTTEHEGIVNWLKAKITAVQAGSGDPSPSNVRAISGWTGANVTVTGKNLLPNNMVSETRHYVEYTRQADGSVKIYGTSNAADGVTLLGSAVAPYKHFPAGSYILSKGDTENYQLYVNMYNGTTYVKQVVARLTDNVPLELDYDGYDGIVVGIYVFNNTTLNCVSHPMIRYSTITDATYEPFRTTYPITFPTSAGTVYGGELTVNADGTGKLVVDKGLYTFTGSESMGWSGTTKSYFNNETIISNLKKEDYTVAFVGKSDRFKAYDGVTAWASISDNVVGYCNNSRGGFRFSFAHQQVSDIATEITGTQILYELATPITYDLSAPQIATLLGLNNLWCDTGDCSFQYSESVDQGDTTTAVTTGEKYNWNNKIDSTEKGAVSGVATLDANGKVPDTQLPYVIDDTAGDGDTDKTWSADKLTDEFEDVNEAIEQLEFKGGSFDYDNIQTFTAEHEGIVNWLKAKIEPVQAGSGDPSPSNVRSIIGFSNANVFAAGKNLIPMTLDNIKQSNTSIGSWSNNVWSYAGMTITVNTDSNGKVSDFTVNGANTSGGAFSFILFASDQFSASRFNGYYLSGGLQGCRVRISDVDKGSTATDDNPSVLINRQNTGKVAIQLRISSSANLSNVSVKPMISKNADDTYEQYVGGIYSISFPTSAGTVYGGELTVNADGTGRLVVTKEYVLLDGSDDEIWVRNTGTYNYFYCEVSNYVDKYVNAEGISDHFTCTAISVNSDSIGFSVTNKHQIRVRYAVDNNLTVSNLRSWLSSNPSTFILNYLDEYKKTYDLSAPQIATLLGQNNLWCDTGETALEWAESEPQGENKSVVSTGEKENWNNAMNRLNTLREQCVPIEVDCGTISSLPTTINDSRITATMVCKPHDYIASNESAITSRLTVTTANGSVTLSGSVSGSTTLKIWLYEPEV